VCLLPAARLLASLGRRRTAKADHHKLAALCCPVGDLQHSPAVGFAAMLGLARTDCSTSLLVAGCMETVRELLVAPPAHVEPGRLAAASTCLQPKTPDVCLGLLRARQHWPGMPLVPRQPLAEAEWEWQASVGLHTLIEERLHLEAVRSRMVRPVGLRPRAYSCVGLASFPNRAYHSTTPCC
jgi:hypothetical protein